MVEQHDFFVDIWNLGCIVVDLDLDDKPDESAAERQVLVDLLQQASIRLNTRIATIRQPHEGEPPLWHSAWVDAEVKRLTALRDHCTLPEPLTTPFHKPWRIFQPKRPFHKQANLWRRWFFEDRFEQMAGVWLGPMRPALDVSANVRDPIAGEYLRQRFGYQCDAINGFKVDPIRHIEAVQRSLPHLASRSAIDLDSLRAIRDRMYLEYMDDVLDEYNAEKTRQGKAEYKVDDLSKFRVVAGSRE